MVGSRKSKSRSGSRTGSKKSNSRASSKKSNSRTGSKARSSSKKSRSGSKARSGSKKSRSGSKKMAGGGKSSMSGAVHGGDIDLFGNISMPMLTLYSQAGCPYCVSFDPVWNQLVTDPRVVGQVILNEVSTYRPLNFVPNPVIEAYPTLLARDPLTFNYIEYSSALPKTLDNIINWMAELNMIKAVDGYTEAVADATVKAEFNRI